MKKTTLLILLLLAVMPLVLAQEATLDISIDGKAYSTGENITYEIRLFDGTTKISSPVDVKIYDYAKKKTMNLTVMSNEQNRLFVEDDFPSGFWNIEASYGTKTAKRIFSIGDREEVKFEIYGDKLIINNTGNTIYTKTVQILIGEKVVTQKQYIEVNGYKEIRLIAPEGYYNIQITDGEESVSFSNVHLLGTGAVIGALDENLVDNPSVLGGARNVSAENIGKSNRSSLTTIFLIGVFGLFVLLTIEQLLKKRMHQKMS